MKHETTVYTTHCGTIFYATCSCNWQSEDYLNSTEAMVYAYLHEHDMWMEFLDSFYDSHPTEEEYELSYR